MMHQRSIAMALLSMLSWSAPRAVAEHREQRQITWEGLSLIVGRKVRIAMPDGARIQGKATRLEADALAVEISQTSNQAAYPIGNFLVPRATLKAVDLEQPTRHWRAITFPIGLAIGCLLGLLAVVSYSTLGQTRHPVTGALAAGAVGVPAVAILLGQKADRRTITYVIKP